MLEGRLAPENGGEVRNGGCQEAFRKERKKEKEEDKEEEA